MEGATRPLKIAIFIYGVLHVVGIIGFHLESLQSLFIDLVPMFLLITLGGIIYFENPKNQKAFLLMVFVFVSGYLVEWLGIHYQFPFGSYSYGETLGIKLFDVPLMIGVNWILVVWGAGYLTQQIIKGYWFKVVVATAIMVGLDFFIEPVAVKYDYWTWANGLIPLQNYLGWAGFSFLLMMVFFKLNKGQTNQLSPWIYLFQLLFFAVFIIF